MEPADRIIRLFGNNKTVAEITGTHRSRVWKWTQPKSAGGSGGRIPQSHHVALLEAAKARGIKLKAEDFLEVPSRAEAGAEKIAERAVA